MSRREDPYKSRPGESDADYLARIEPIQAAEQKERAEREAEWSRSPDNLRIIISMAETIDDLKGIMLLMVDAIEAAS